MEKASELLMKEDDMNYCSCSYEGFWEGSVKLDRAAWIGTYDIPPFAFLKQ